MEEHSRIQIGWLEKRGTERVKGRRANNLPGVSFVLLRYREILLPSGGNDNCLLSGPISTDERSAERASDNPHLIISGGGIVSRRRGDKQAALLLLPRVTEIIKIRAHMYAARRCIGANRGRFSRIK